MILVNHTSVFVANFLNFEPFEQAVAIIQTGDPCPVANMILTKGLILPTDDDFGGDVGN